MSKGAAGRPELEAVVHTTLNPFRAVSDSSLKARERILRISSRCLGSKDMSASAVCFRGRAYTFVLPHDVPNILVGQVKVWISLYTGIKRVVVGVYRAGR